MIDNKVIRILMQRDGFTEEEAMEQLAEACLMIEGYNYNPEKTEDIVRDFLGLEMDYIDDVLGF